MKNTTWTLLAVFLLSCACQFNKNYSQEEVIEVEKVPEKKTAFKSEETFEVPEILLPNEGNPTLNNLKIVYAEDTSSLV